MQDAMSEVFDVYRTVDNKKFSMQAERAEEVTEAAREVDEELNRQMTMRNLKLSIHEEGKEGKSEVLCTCKWMTRRHVRILSTRKARRRESN